MPAPIPVRWLDEVDDALACRAPGVVLTFNTADRVLLGDEPLPVAFLRYAIAHRFSARGYHVGYYAAASGFERLTPPHLRHALAGPDPYPDVPSGVAEPSLVLVPAGRALRSCQSRALLILDYADHLLPATAGGTSTVAPAERMLAQLVHAWGQDDAIRRSQNFVILISYEDGFNSILTQSGAFRRVAVDLPSNAERAAFARLLADMRNTGFSEIGCLAEDFGANDFAGQTAGLRLSDIETLFRRSAVDKRPVSRNDVRVAKQHAIRQLSRDLIEVIEPTGGFETVAGAGHAKSYIDLIRGPWAANASSVPGAVLLAGVPGCGKSHIVHAVARELSAPLLSMRSVRDSLVGQSERNLELVLRIAEGLSPCILYTDEIDQAIGQRSTGGSLDSGTSERMLARLFEFFGSMRHRGRILWIGATNRPDVLDPALLDRFQVVIPFIHPTRAERAELLPMLASQVGRSFAADVECGDIAALESLSGLTVRSLQEIVVSAGLRGGSGPIQKCSLIAAIDDYKPNYDAREHEFLALKALGMTTFHSLLPWMSSAGLSAEAELPEYVQDLIDRTTGRLCAERLHLRLADLERSRVEARTRR